METILLEKDIPLLVLAAASFPNGVLAAHQELHRRVPPVKERSYFGLSRPEGGVIRYQAAAEQLSPEEGRLLGLGTVVLPRGRYLSHFLPNFMQQVSLIGATFQQLLQHPELDPEGWCVEWYGAEQKNVTLLVRLNDE